MVELRLPRLSGPSMGLFLPRAVASAVMVEGCIVLLGWITDSPVLRSVIPGLVAMNRPTRRLSS
jgi:hypothetical protein